MLLSYEATGDGAAMHCLLLGRLRFIGHGGLRLLAIKVVTEPRMETVEYRTC